MRFHSTYLTIKLLLFTLLLTGLSQADTPKWATVDMQRLFKEYHRTTSAQLVFNKEYARIQKGINERSERLNQLKRMMTQNQKFLQQKDISDAERKNKQREQQMMLQELRMTERGINVYSAQERGKVAQQKAASMRGIMTEIKQRVAEHAAKNGYDYVFDKSGKNTNQITFFVFLKDAADVTPALLKELNKHAPKGK